MSLEIYPRLLFYGEKKMKIKLLIFALSLSILYSTGVNIVIASTTEQQRQTFGQVFVSSLRFVRSGGMQMEGNKIDLDVDRDTSLTGDTDDRIDFEIGGSDVVRLDAVGLVITNVLNIADADSVLSGTNTITPTSSYLQTAPVDQVLTMTIATGAAVDGDILIVHNLNTTNTVIIDTGATAGGGNITLGQDDPAGFIFGDGVWVELFSPDNS